jgi:ribosomal protein L10
MSTRIERTEAIEAIEKKLTGATGIYLTDFNKINVEKMTQFRRDIRNAGGKYVVVKNTLTSLAFEKCGLNELTPFIKGPIGIAYTTEEATSPAKVIRDFKKKNKNLLDLKIALLDGNLFDAKQVAKLADLPSREILLSQLLSCLNAPMTNLVCTLNGLFTKFLGTLEAVKNKKESDN